MDQAYIKRHNIERVLSTLDQHQPLTRADLTHITDMSPASVTRIIGALGAMELIEETQLARTSGRGRRAVHLHTRPGGMYSLGFHINTRCLRMCLLDFGNRVVHSETVGLTADDLAPEALARLASEQIARVPAPLQPELRRLRVVGVSLSGRVDIERGTVASSAAFGWTNVRLGEAFERQLHLPVRIENDVKACLTWERVHRGLAEDFDLAYLYIGRAGIGFANTVNGTLVRGRSNSSGEIEEARLGTNEKLSDHLMENSMLRRAQVVSPAVESIADILDAYRMRLPWAVILLDDFRTHLNIVLQMIESMLDPHLIILGGDVAEALAGLDGLLPDEHYCVADRFDESCTAGAALIAMREAVQARIGGLLDAPDENGERP